MSFRKRVRSLALLAWLPLVLTTCGGASFDDPGTVKGLRVIAVQKSAPYPKPGEQVDLKLVFWDGKSSEDNPRDIYVAISPAPCENPAGDLYYNCLASPGSIPIGGSGTPDAGTGTPDAGTDVPEGGTASSAPGSAGFVAIKNASQAPFRNLASAKFVRATPSRQGSALHDIDHVHEASVRISSEIIDLHQATPGVPRYGVAYVLFLLCAGTPKLILNAGPNTFPLGCFDAEDHLQGPDDFVVGYTSIYVYGERINNNPVIDDFLFDGQSLADSTTDEARVQHIPSCKESDRTKCPKFAVKPAVNRGLTVEIDDDPSARTPDGQQLQEQAWVSYYITRGELKSSVRLVNDATRGWNEQNGTEYTAPAEPGPVRLFAVIHDNRGGVAWAEGKIVVD
ncbi:MAG TPA: hypothetical protein VK550_02915 [Polyangiaceae bacterium]|nr:hypothetical protein [Polyangiaceae bacterium]